MCMIIMAMAGTVIIITTMTTITTTLSSLI
jgi:hypothetical protein